QGCDPRRRGGGGEGYGARPSELIHDEGDAGAAAQPRVLPGSSRTPRQGESLPVVRDHDLRDRARGVAQEMTTRDRRWVALGAVAGPVLLTLAWFVLGFRQHRLQPLGHANRAVLGDQPAPERPRSRAHW